MTLATKCKHRAIYGNSDSWLKCLDCGESGRLLFTDKPVRFSK